MNTTQNFKDKQENQVQQYTHNANDNIFSNMFISKAKFRKIIKKISKLNTRKGYMLLFMVFFFGMIGLALLLEPLAVSSVAVYKTRFEIAREHNESINIAISSPVRKFIVDQMYTNIQNLLVYHINAANGSAAYSCNGQTTQPTSVDPIGGALENQFGLCSPETALYGLLGDTNQSINFLDTLYPTWRQPITDKTLEGVRQMMIRKYENNFSYTLRSTYVGKEVVSQGVSATGSTRSERYHWLVRSDIESNTYDSITGGMVVYYDVYLTNSYYPGNFYGAGSACDEKTSYTNLCGTDSQGNAISCAPVMVQLPNGSWGFAVQYGTDDPDYQTVPPGCTFETISGALTMKCPIPGNKFVIALPSHGVRQQTGCASLNTGVAGVTAPDNGGYGFSLTVRIVSIGNPYN